MCTLYNTGQYIQQDTLYMYILKKTFLWLLLEQLIVIVPVSTQTTHASTFLSADL